MFCKNCGAQMNGNAAFCVTCGAAAGQGTGYCGNCGNATAPGAAVCLNCGAALANGPTAPNGAFVGTDAPKSKTAAGVLGILLGAFGAHNFYLGYTGKAVAQLLITVLSCFTLSVVSEIWGLVEGIMILTGSANFTTDAKGVPLQ
ncbi:MAG: TM2 domain-containing protein [Oscillospiraceae bacterium]|nr:TM2 domain-containing protein [Oscillospiraceae bacterium]